MVKQVWGGEIVVLAFVLVFGGRSIGEIAYAGVEFDATLSNVGRSG
ncbi:MAG: hypothetical protein QMB52_06690 [Propionivibrio sp.]